MAIILDQSLLEFLILSQCRMREHYLVKLCECIAVLGEEQLWQPIDGTAGRTIGGMIRHILEHPRRHAEWIRSRSKPPNEPRFEDFFPSSLESLERMQRQVDDIFNEWVIAMQSLIDGVRAGDSLPAGGPGMEAIYHLVEHVSYHLGQVILATEKVTGHKFDFCQRGIDERAMHRVVNGWMSSIGEI